MRPTRNARRVREIAGDLLIGLAIFFVVLALAVLDSHAARSASMLAAKTPAARAPALGPASVTMGTLLLRETDADSDHRLTAATRLDTNVDITVTGPIARATVTQRFRNTGKGWVEGVYAFPLPEMAAVDALSMHIGERVVKGKITPRDEARQMYEAAKHAGRKASLLSQHRPNVFTSAVANIGPGEDITIRIEYQETLRRNGDGYALRFPLVAAPRYTPKTPVHPVNLDRRTGVSGPNPPVLDPAGGKINPVSLQVRLNSGFPLGDVTSATHEIALRRTGEETALLALTRGHVPADRDFELTWRAKQAALPLITAFQEGLGDDSYVLAMLAPPKIDAAPAPMPREVTFVIDTSGSMAGDSILQAKESLTHALKRLKPGDRFNIIRFDNDFGMLFKEPAAVTTESLAIAMHFVSQLEAGGGTRMLPALKAALAGKRKNGGKRIRQMVFLTDGAISNEAELLSTLASHRGRARLFMAGIGSAPNSFLMRRAAEIGRGSFVHISTESQVLTRMNRLLERLERPVITDLKAEWASGLRADVWPNPLPDLYSGEPLLVTARLPALKGDLKISGKIAGRPWTHILSLASAKKGNGVGKFWARHKIASLEARRYAGQSARDVETAIEAVAMEHGLVSRMTSIVAVDATPSRPEDQPLASEDLPVNLPAGWVYDKVFGSEPAGSGLHKTRAAKLPMTGMQSRTAKPAPAASASRFTAGEDTATPSSTQTSKLALNGSKPGLARPTASGDADTSGRTWMLSVMALIFAVMTALTLGLWRHLRHAVVARRSGRRV